MSVSASAGWSGGSLQVGFPRIRAVLAAIMAIFLSLVCADAALAAPRFAAIAVDAHSGKVLFARDADGQCYPASLTKIMTLYVLFQEMGSGRLTRDTRLPVSQRAASREPSKLYLKPGETIRVDDAIRALVTKSANDVATVIAEAISGSEQAFAERMTRTARSIGMTRTTFRNANGLPDPGQVTTARDMATLGLRIQRDFPQYYGYFSLKSFTYKGKTHGNHNRLMAKFKGMDGIKTGYIRASGFNLVTSAERSGKRLVGVVIGGKSTVSRNQYMASMLETQFDKATFARGGRIAAAAGDPPGYVRNQMAEDVSRRSAVRGRAEPDELAAARQQMAEVQAAIQEIEKKSATRSAVQPQPVEADVAGRLAAEKLRAARLAAQKQLAAKHAADSSAAIVQDAPLTPAQNGASETVAAATDQAAGQIAAKMAEASLVPALPGKSDNVTGQTFASVVVGEAQANSIEPGEEGVQSVGKSDNLAALETPVAAPAPSAGTWTIQIGAFPAKEGAERRIEEVRGYGLQALAGKAAFTMNVQIGNEILFRARFSGFTEATARAACKSLVAKGISCFPLSPQG